MRWSALEGLFRRSHVWRLLVPFCERYASPVGGKLDFSLLVQVRYEFEHLCEVFEQDLRIGEQDDAVAYCSDDHVSVLKSAVWRLVGEGLASRALLVSDEEKERAASWA